MPTGPLAAIVLVTGCAPLDDSSIYSSGFEPVLCGYNIDNKNEPGDDELAAALDRARTDRQILHLYGHSVPVTLDLARLETLFAGVADRGMAFVTYRDLVEGFADEPGLAFSFDDRDVVSWHALRPVFARYGARVTFFVTRFHAVNEQERAMLHELEADGHAIEYHSTEHLRAPDVVEGSGLGAYLETEIFPDLELMRGAGFDPIAYAYPSGARTAETDRALLDHFAVVRASDFHCPR